MMAACARSWMRVAATMKRWSNTRPAAGRRQRISQSRRSTPAGPATAQSGYRHAQKFEALRDLAERVKPKVFLACLGTAATFTPRANFAANTYATGGMHAVPAQAAQILPPLHKNLPIAVLKLP